MTASVFPMDPWMHTNVTLPNGRRVRMPHFAPYKYLDIVEAMRNLGTGIAMGGVLAAAHRLGRRALASEMKAALDYDCAGLPHRPATDEENAARTPNQIAQDECGTRRAKAWHKGYMLAMREMGGGKP